MEQSRQVLKLEILGNPNLRWETTTQTNVGLDMLILNGRLGITADYFVKNTTDLLLNEPLPQYAGGCNISRNVGETENSGFEFSITSTVIDNTNFQVEYQLEYVIPYE